MLNCLFCSKNIYGNYPFCKKHTKKRLLIDEYNKLPKLKKLRMCKHILTTGKNKGFLCSRVVRLEDNCLCNIHKRVNEGICYVSHCNNTAIKKTLMCKYHTNMKTPICMCNRHNYIAKNIENTFTIPSDILIYIYSFSEYNESKILKCLSKEYYNSIILNKNNFIPMQINIPEEILTKQIAFMLYELEEEDSSNMKKKLCLEIYKLLSKNLYLCKRHKKFYDVSLEKILEFQDEIPELFQYYRIILQGTKIL